MKNLCRILRCIYSEHESHNSLLILMIWFSFILYFSCKVWIGKGVKIELTVPCIYFLRDAMKFQIITDHVLRIILSMANQEDQVSPVKEVADALGMTYGFFYKVVIWLRQHGFLKSIQEPNIGYSLPKKAALYDMVMAMKGGSLTD